MAGAVFASLPVYYYYMGRDAGLRAVLPQSGAGDVTERDATAVSSPSQPNRFASRLTYELKRLPEEPPPPPVRPAAPPPVAVAPVAPAPAPARVAAAPAPVVATAPAPAPPAPAAAAPMPGAPPKPAATPVSAPVAKAPPPAPPEPVAVVPGPRITNARPIRVDPLEARDTTREIAKDVRKPEAPAAKEASKSAAPLEARTVIAATTPAKPALSAPTESAPPAAKGALAANAAAEGDVVAARYAATRDWLASAPETTHTIQIMGISNDAQLKAHLSALSKSLEASKIYIFRTAANGKPWITVVYGAYADRAAALQALAKLPSTVSSTKPVIRTVNGIRTEMKQNGTS